ncbi:hypothetical protein ACE1TF_06360 [Geomicrobium sp. JSM 1781026]|uniref:hypothetical protein n=1 Tax=Geomicrobium sp. JSM 1781026 TaxID=3344580 RepID=UPI0035C00F16
MKTLYYISSVIFFGFAMVLFGLGTGVLGYGSFIGLAIIYLIVATTMHRATPASSS